MNLAGDNTKRLLRSLRTGGTPTSIGLWAAVNAVEQIRKRNKPEKALLVRKKLKPGETYVVRIPEEGQAPISETLASSGIGSELVAAATEMLTSDESPASPEPEPEPEPLRLSRRQRRRAGRLDKLEEGVVDPQSLPRRQRRRLAKAERKARRRPSRRRVRRARRLQKSAAKSLVKAERKAGPSRRARRRQKRREAAAELWQRKNEKRSTRRRRRKLAKAQKALGNE